MADCGKGENISLAGVTAVEGPAIGENVGQAGYTAVDVDVDVRLDGVTPGETISAVSGVGGGGSCEEAKQSPGASFRLSGAVRSGGNIPPFLKPARTVSGRENTSSKAI